jgi:hypothetical protein
LRCELEKLEGRLSLGETVDLDQFGRVAGHYRRICERLGIKRRSRDVTVSSSAPRRGASCFQVDDEVDSGGLLPDEWSNLLGPSFGPAMWFRHWYRFQLL